MSDASASLEMTRLGSYNIVRKLARGGMAELYLARSVGPEGFEKLVVLKKILPKYAENPRFVQLFLDEAKLAASLDHPHIVQVYDMGRVEGNYFFTMEYVHGQDVRALLRHASRQKRQLPIAIAVQIARNIASALHHAHERRRPDGNLRDVVHRDVSPSNILVSYDGAVKLADFGVAKASSSTVRTRTGALKGKVGYMSPEQARGAAIDRRSDIFSLGVVLWELVCMRRLFKSDNDLATIQSIIHGPPQSLLELRADCPPGLDRIARTALEKEPATRYQSAQLMQRDLDELGRELKLDQSSIALSHFMNEVFEAEIAAWREAQSQGSTVTDFVVAGGGGAGAPSGPDLVTPASESDFSLDPADEADDDDDDDGPEMDEEMSEPTALPPQLAPRSGVIAANDGDEATDFGPPPQLDSPPARATTPTPPPAPSADLDPPTTKPGKGLEPITPPTPLAPVTLPSTPVAKPPTKPLATTPRSPVVPNPERDNPFDSMATRLRPNPLRAEDNPFDQAPTAISSPAFTEEAPTVQAPPDIVKRAFDEPETVVSAPRFREEVATVPFNPGFDPATEPTELAGASTSPFPKESLDTNPFAQAAAATTPYASTLAPYAQQPAQPPSIYVAPQTPPAGIPAMPVGPGMPGAYGAPMPGMHGGPMHPSQGQMGMRSGTAQVTPMGLPGYHDQSLNIDLAPRRRWLIIAAVAVGVAVLAIVLVVVLSGGPEEEPEPEPPDPKSSPKRGR